MIGKKRRDNQTYFLSELLLLFCILFFILTGSQQATQELMGALHFSLFIKIQLNYVDYLFVDIEISNMEENGYGTQTKDFNFCLSRLMGIIPCLSAQLSAPCAL